MPNISIKSIADLVQADSPDVYVGATRTLAYFEGVEDPLHLYLHEIDAGQWFRIGESAFDRIAYVWQGEVDVQSTCLRSGSSLIVENGGSVEIVNGQLPAVILTFSSASPSRQITRGGNIHLLPVENVPRYEQSTGLQGGLHADSDCETCKLWLHENHFPSPQDVEPVASEKGIHAHSEDEIIFVTAGEMVFGRVSAKPGTALAIAADTFYSFSAGAPGLSFINFRADRPTDIRFKSGQTMSETGYWKKLVDRPRYVTPGEIAP